MKWVIPINLKLNFLNKFDLHQHNGVHSSFWLIYFIHLQSASKSDNKLTHSKSTAALLSIL